MLAFLYLFLGSSMLNFLYFASFLKFSSKGLTSSSTPSSFPVSIIVYAKNEADELRQFLPRILSQDYPDFQLVLVNDASMDETLEVMEDFQSSHPRISIVDVKNNEAFWGNKKYALTLGIKKATHPHLLLTHADCQPVSSNWISEMIASFTIGKSIVLGHSGYFKKKYSLLNKLIRFESLQRAIQSYSQALWNNPYMGTGRNLAFTTEEFYRRNGYAGHLHIRGGEDDLFVNEAADAGNTAVCYTRDSIIRSESFSNFRVWLLQKRHQASVVKHYKTKHLVYLGLFYVSQSLFWLFFIILLSGTFWVWALAVLGFRFLLQGIVYYGAAKKLDETDLVWLFPFLEIFLICTQIGIFISTIISKPTHWK